MNNQVLGVATQVMLLAIVISVILLFLGVGVLVTIHVCIAGRTFRRRFGSSTAMERGSIGNTSMSKDDVEKLPCYDFKARDKGSGGTGSPVVDCAVCLDNFKVGDKCRLLPLCKHSFHAQCVDIWLLKTPICPICRSTTESSHFSESGIELSLRESQAAESGRFSEIAVELREEEGQTAETEQSGVVVMR